MRSRYKGKRVLIQRHFDESPWYGEIKAVFKELGEYGYIIRPDGAKRDIEILAGNIAGIEILEAYPKAKIIYLRDFIRK